MIAFRRQPKLGKKTRRLAAGRAHDTHLRCVFADLRAKGLQRLVRLHDPRASNAARHTLQTLEQLVGLDLLSQISHQSVVVVVFLECRMALEFAHPRVGDAAAQPLREAPNPVRVHRADEGVRTMQRIVEQFHLPADDLLDGPVKAFHLLRCHGSAREQSAQIIEQLTARLLRDLAPHDKARDQTQGDLDLLVYRGVAPKLAAHDHQKWAFDIA
mmetsp:Transcript_1887/g.5648  ORF Transcript_1887/g.5648 Transcript_1887/m.5648 type:complete len:214 (-) Transcript_1887:1156-1797(-)